MLKPRHHHVGGASTYTPLPAAAPPANVPTTTPTGYSTSQQRSAAAWAWFERGGSSACITPRKAEGLIAVKRHVKGTFLGRPSRFRQEVLSRETIMHRHSFRLSEYDATAAKDYGRRRHSFHEYDVAAADSTSMSLQTFSMSGRISTAPKAWSFHMQDGAGANKNQAEDEETRHKDQAISSLLDDSEVEAVFRELRSHLRTGTEGSACTAGTHKLYMYEVQSPTHREPPRASKSSDDHQILPDKRHSESGNDHVLHRLLRLRSRLLGPSRSSRSTIPALCSSIATADCIVDHHRPLPIQLAGSGSTSKVLRPTTMSHLRPQHSKSHYTWDAVESRTACTQHRHVLHQHVHHIHHHHYHHLRGASLDVEMKGDVRALLASPN